MVPEMGSGAGGQEPAFRSRLFDARIVLLLGLGGLLALMTAAGIYTTRTLTNIRAKHEEIRRGYLERNRALNQIRTDLYLSSTYVRDYLLDPDVQTAEENHLRFDATRADLDHRSAQYGQMVLPEQANRWRELQESLNQYWIELAPVFTWTQEERRVNGYDYYRNQVVTRRSHLLTIANEIGAFNEQQLTEGDRELDAVFDAVQQRLLVTLVLSLFCGGAIAFFAAAKLLALERRASELYREAEVARHALQELSARLVAAQEEERKVISRELHDEVGQSLSGLLVGLSNVRAMISSTDQPEVDEQLKSVRKLAEDIVRVVRNMALLLRPSMLDDLGLSAAIQWHAREVSRNHGLAVAVDADSVPEDLPEAHSLCIYRVVQECLHNAVRHSGAQHVNIVMRREPEALAMSIKDDGKGIQAGHKLGLGLLGMKERVTHLGGSFRVRSEPGTGTEVSVTLPLNNGTPS